MQKILVTRAVFPEVLERLAEHFEVHSNQADVIWSAPELMARLADKDGALSCAVDPLDAAVLAGAPRLRALCTIAVGYNNIDLGACKRASIVVTHTPGVLDDTTADMAWALMLASGRHVLAADQWLRAGHWRAWKFAQWLGQDVHHATLSILGMGRIGQAVARRAAGFSMRVLYHNRRRCDAAVERQCNATWVDLPTLLRQADFLVPLLPYSAQAHHIIGAAELALLKPTAHVINVARGGVIDDAALIEALAARRIAGAGLDVFEHEPALDPRFLSLDNVVLTPHIGSASAATRMTMAMLAVDNLIAVLSGERPPNPVALPE